MRAAVARVANSLAPDFTKGTSYRELPSRDQSPLGSPTTTHSRFDTGSPTRGNMSEAWRNTSSARRRLQVCLRSTPRRLFTIALFGFCAAILIVGGGVKARRYIQEEDVSPPAEEEPVDEGYHWLKYPM